ncbi:hypothetical protein MYCTH_2309749 [Thermothelomyces thermophilus ATCC 42464]|uniref:Uncharacterized protein n=1 Tax=Thermothelomyces thermophilus (strain ATCC 42464 / BCRC 31852 / DSM 1799) TaxID=573729 RepID=G2QKM8_THET4|nr:uncharacterized protein MYCTH_2309749 [Thermothelomyces thermophilus ATCC 42464]AEO60510.1 hypothetical protein MYCTH_2309749 [Thermothelomyces thermophilus ATCC 42464]
MRSLQDVLLVFDCTALPGIPDERRGIRVEVGMAPCSASKKTVARGLCSGEISWRNNGKDGTTGRYGKLAVYGVGDVQTSSVHRVCSLIKEDLQTTQLVSTVFSSQLGGGHLLDIYLPRLAPPLTTGRQSLN